MQIMLPTKSAMTETRFDEKYLAEAFAALENPESRPISKDGPQYDLEHHAQNITRLKSLDECENAIADLSPNVAEYLSRVFDQITDSFLPAPIWQTPNPPSKKGEQRESDVVLRSLRIVSAARLALASHGAPRDRELKQKVDRLYQAAARYLDGVPQFGNLQDIEALLLLAELEFARNQDGAARARLKSVISALTDSTRMRSSLIFGQSLTLIRRRNALRTALMMLHWYFTEVPSPLEGLNVEPDLEPGETLTNADEVFVTSQLKLGSLHHRLKKFLDAQPFVDEKTWTICERAFSIWYDEQRERSKELDWSSEDAPINFFVFHQQYLCTRIMLSKSHARLYKRRSDIEASNSEREVWTCPASAKNDAIKIASSLRNYGQKHRFREAPLSFVNHISAAADIVINATEAATSEDDRNAYLHISSFLYGVLKYMAEVHVRAGTLLEAVQQYLNTVIHNGRVRPKLSAVDREDSSVHTVADDTHLWQWTRYDLSESLGHIVPPSAPERPRSVVGVLPIHDAESSKRPALIRQLSTPAKLAAHPEASAEDLQAPTPSFYSVKDNMSIAAQSEHMAQAQEQQVAA